MTEDGQINPEFFALLERECGPVSDETLPDGPDKYFWYTKRYNKKELPYNYLFDAALYISDESFDSDNYNEKSIKR